MYKVIPARRFLRSRRIIREGNRENLRAGERGRRGTAVFVFALKGITGSLGRIPQIIPNAENTRATIKIWH